MRVLLPARHGLGNLLDNLFIGSPGRRMLARIACGLKTGLISSAMAVYEHWYNPATGDLLRALPMNLAVLTTRDLMEIGEKGADNAMPFSVRWHQNLLSNPPSQFAAIAATDEVPCPVSKPALDLPPDFVLFSDAASKSDRCLTDPAIYDFLSSVTHLPIVKVGAGHDLVPADINLSGRLRITETLYIARLARLVVAPLTFFRTFSSLFEVPVIELAQHATAETIERTRVEYECGAYGVTPRYNRWFSWPGERDAVQNAVRSLGGF